ncbi:hypothetical protein DPMN_057615 [Dreissena polymorpha]|uniref:Uncharacterized protein n=1 Tax=Dreissena polymorpha TaxID=45954 RepID=A0A9D4C0K7_DREPO|nr:hypothetical protein DPMN_057615 [Dreissena polymorpha]
MAGADNNHWALFDFVIPLPLVEPPAHTFKLLIKTCSIIKSVDRPPQYRAVLCTTCKPEQNA